MLSSVVGGSAARSQVARYRYLRRQEVGGRNLYGTIVGTGRCRVSAVSGFIALITA
jgi:hypothetical protein